MTVLTVVAALMTALAVAVVATALMTALAAWRWQWLRRR
jgi:hypothetical protein